MHLLYFVIVELLNLPVDRNYIDSIFLVNAMRLQNLKLNKFML